LKLLPPKYGIEWRLIAPHLGLFLTIFTAFAVSGVFLWTKTAVLEERVESGRRELAYLKGEIGEKTSSLDLARRHREVYRYLRASHVLGEIDRLQLIEAVNDVRRALSIPEMIDRFYPEEERDEYQGLSPRLHRFQVTDHFLEFSIRDETELLRVLERLRSPRFGFHVVEACTMNRRKRELRLDGGNIKGKCRLAWLTLEVRREKELAEREDEAVGGASL